MTEVWGMQQGREGSRHREHYRPSCHPCGQLEVILSGGLWEPVWDMPGLPPGGEGNGYLFIP